LSRIELEDARVELERASDAAKLMSRDVEDENGDVDDNGWEECVMFYLIHKYALQLF